MLAFTNDSLVSVLGVLLVGISFRLAFPLGTQLINEAIITDDRATTLSITAMIAELIAVFTNLAFGKLADCDLSIAMGFAGILSILGMCLYQYGAAENFCKKQ